MEQFNKTPTTGKFGEIAKVIDTNFGLVLTKLMELEESGKSMNCGFYDSVAALKLAYPNPEKGMMAYVGTGETYTVYRCTTGGTWTKTSETYKIDLSINLDALATKEALNEVKNDVTELKKGAVYGGIASTITNPGTPTVKVFYLPIEVGTYTHFGGIEITETDVAFLYWDGTAWVKHSLNLSSVIESIKKTASDAGIEAKNALDAAAKAADQAKQAKSAADTNKNSIDGLTRTVGDIETKVNGLNVPKIVCLTQAEYEALEVKDPDTFYYTNEE